MKKLSNLEYEASLLGCLLIDQNLIDDMNIFDGIFTNDDHKKVFRALKLARKKSVTVDELMIAKLDISREVIASICFVASSANVKFYHDELKGLWKLREIRQMSSDCIEMLNTDPPEKIIEYVEKLITGFISVHDSGYKKMSDRIPECLESIQKAIANKGQISGIPTGLKSLDDLCGGWQKQDYVVIGARPSKGKTTIAMDMIRAAAGNGKRVGIISSEMADIALMKRMISSGHSIQADRLRTGLLMPADIQKIDEAMGFFADTNIFIDDTPNIAFNKLKSEARKMRRIDNIEVLYIDYIGLLQHENKDIPRFDQIGEISRGIKGLARELDIPIIALSQLTRDSQGKRPTLANIRESGSIEQDADIVAFLHDEEGESGWVNGDPNRIKYQLIIAKARNYATKDIDIIFEKSYNRFIEAPERSYK